MRWLSLLQNRPSWKVFCLGNTTRKLVKKFFGEDAVAGFAENADNLSKKILQNSSIQNITFFCGDKRRDELPAKLNVRAE